jgi:hypothetical protein
LTAKGWTPVLHSTLVDVFSRGMLSWLEIRVVCYVLDHSTGRWNSKTKQHYVYTKPMTKYYILKECGISTHRGYEVIKRLIERNALEESSKHGWRVNQDWGTWVSPKSGDIPEKRVSPISGESIPEKRGKYPRKAGKRNRILTVRSKQSRRRYNNKIKTSKKKGRRDGFEDVIPKILRKRTRMITGLDPAKAPLQVSMALHEKAKECPNRRLGCRGLKKGSPLYPVCFYCANRKSR